MTAFSCCDHLLAWCGPELRQVLRDLTHDRMALLAEVPRSYLQLFRDRGLIGDLPMPLS